MNKSFIYFTVGEFITKLFPFITLLLVAKMINSDELGRIGLYMVILEIFSVLISNNIAVTTRIDFFKLNQDKFLVSINAHFATIFLIFGCLFLGLLFVNIFIDIIEYIILLIIALLRSSNLFYITYLQCIDKPKSVLKHNLGFTLVSNVFFVGLIFLKYDSIYAWLLSIGLVSLCHAVLIMLKIHKSRQLNFGVINLKRIKAQFRRAAVFFPQSLAFWIRSGSDRFFISSFLNFFILGSYTLVFQLTLPITILLNSINTFNITRINTYIKSKEFDQLNILLKQMTMLIIATSILLYGFSYVIIIKFYVYKYTHALQILNYMIVTVGLNAIALLYLNIFYYIGKEKVVTLVVVTLGFFQIFSSSLSIHFFGLNGMMISIVIINLFFTFLTIKIFYKWLRDANK